MAPYKLVMCFIDGTTEEVEFETRLAADNFLLATPYKWFEYWEFGEFQFKRHA